MKRIGVWIYGLGGIGLGIIMLGVGLTPFWLIVAKSAYCIFYGTAGIYTFEVERATRNTTSGICRQCGYDLRATPERCPECGTVPANDKVL